MKVSRLHINSAKHVTEFKRQKDILEEELGISIKDVAFLGYLLKANKKIIEK